MHTRQECRDFKRRYAELQEDARRTQHAEDRTELEREFWQEEAQGWAKRAFDRNKVSIRRLWDELVDDGRAIREDNFGRDSSRFGVRLQEAGSSVNTGAFSNVIGQMAYQTVLDEFTKPNYLADKLVTVEPASTQFQEIVPGVAGLGDVAEIVGEGQPYPLVGTSEEWITIPKKDKRGAIVPVTKEIVNEDKTGLFLSRVSAVAESMAVNYEKEILDLVTGVTSTYSRNGGPIQATYADTHTQGDFDNLVASNALADYSDIDAVVQAFNAITDPNTGEPVMLSQPYDLIVPQALELTARLLASASSIEVGADSATYRTINSNPFPQGSWLNLLSNPYVSSRSGSSTTWFMGNSKKAFSYRELWPISTEQAAPNSPEAFYSDIALAFKVSRFGKGYVREPRYMVKCTA